METTPKFSLPALLPAQHTGHTPKLMIYLEHSSKSIYFIFQLHIPLSVSAGICLEKQQHAAAPPTAAALTGAVRRGSTPRGVFLTVAAAVAHQHPSRQAGVLDRRGERQAAGSRQHCVGGYAGVAAGDGCGDDDRLGRRHGGRY